MCESDMIFICTFTNLHIRKSESFYEYAKANSRLLDQPLKFKYAY
jgi:hypothetical protein